MDLAVNGYSYANKIPFKSSQVNIVSTADNHGDLLSMPQMMKAIQMNKRDLFEKSGEKSTANIFAIAGDFFMNPNKKGFLTSPEFSNGDVQYNFLTKMIYTAKTVAGNNNFDAVYVPGNHCYDGGDVWLYKKLGRAPMTTILTNLNRNISPLASKLMEENENVVTEKIIEIPDSKKAKKVNKVLVLGVTIPSMSYYNPGLLEGTVFYDNSTKNDAYLQPNDLVQTVKVVKKHVSKFKKENPNGAVVVMAHTGNKISNLIADKVPGINLILNGHDHKEFEVMHGNTLILSHGQGSRFLRSAVLKFNDKGQLEEIKAKKIETDKYDKPARNDKKLQEFLAVNLKDDLVPIVTFKDDSGTPEEMVLNDTIRYSNSILANYITSAIKRPLRIKYPQIDAVGIPASTFRSGLKSNERRHTLNNLDLMKMFDGVSENLSQIKVGKISGQDFCDLVIENTINNLKSKTRNVLIQWSDIQINRTLVKQIQEGKSDASLYDCVKIKNNKTREFEPLDLTKEYTIALPEKYLSRNTSSVRVPSRIKDNFEDTGETYDSLFRTYLKMINYDVKITDKSREKRIL